MAADLQGVFGPQGPLARDLPAYRFRPQQLAMAEAIAHAIEERGQLLAEAGTGTGKTFAYLVPALLSGGKVIISTGTKTLQDQLFQRDLPLVRDSLRLPVTVALLKGRANYVCHHHLRQASVDGTFASRADVRYLKRIEAFARRSTTGDKAELADVPDTAAVWMQVTSTRDNCLGGECPDYGECFVMNARKDALAADVVVVNHHLFFADVMLRDEGLTELLPACNTVILDEAHQLPDTATLFFGEELTAGQLGELARDAEIEGLKAARDYAPLPEAAQNLAQALRRFRLGAGEAPGKWPQLEAMRRSGFVEADALAAALDALAAELAGQAERSDELAHCAQRAADAIARLARWREGPARDADAEWIRWLEVTPGGWQLHASPLSIAEIFSRQVTDTARSWILTSATLAVGCDFTLYRNELGLATPPPDAGTAVRLPEPGTPVPPGLPEPNSSSTPCSRRRCAGAQEQAAAAFLLFDPARAGRASIAAAFTGGLDYRCWCREGSRSELLA